MPVAKDRLNIPNFIYDPDQKELIKIKDSDWVNPMYTGHHFIRQQWARNNPKKYEKVKRLQKIIFLPTFLAGFNNIHAELESKHSKFKERYGYDIYDLLFDEDNWSDYINE